MTESIAFSTDTPTVINVTWAKGKCDTYTLSSDGSFFLGHMYPQGRALISSTIKECHQDLTFMYYIYRVFSNWSPCSRSIKKFNLMPPGMTYSCELILIIGVAYDNTKDALNYHYLQWKGPLGEYDFISQAMSMLNRLDKFIRQMFDTTIVVKPSTNIHIIFLNQIAGPTLGKWRCSPSISSVCGRMYHQMSLGPDIWFKIWVNPVFRSGTIVGPCGSTGNIDIVSY